MSQRHRSSDVFANRRAHSVCARAVNTKETCIVWLSTMSAPALLYLSICEAAIAASSCICSSAIILPIGGATAGLG